MKIRTDFVTNSSSSSYVIAYKTLPAIDEETIFKYPFLKGYSKMIEKILLTKGDNDTNAGNIYTTLEAYEQYLISEWGWGDYNTIEKICENGDYFKRMYEKCKDLMNRGFNILVKSVDYNDTYCSNIIYEIAKNNDNFIILEDE